MKQIFKKYHDDQIHGNATEYLGEAKSVVDMHEKLYDQEHFPSEDGGVVLDQNGIVIWEAGDKSIDSGYNWTMYEKDLDRLTGEELFEIYTSKRVLKNHFETYLMLNDYDVDVFRVAEEIDMVYQYLNNGDDEDIMSRVVVAEDSDCDITILDDNGIEKWYNLK